MWFSKISQRTKFTIDLPSKKIEFHKGPRFGEIIQKNGELISFHDKVKLIVKKYKPDIILHLAAQPIVRKSYEIPKHTCVYYCPKRNLFSLFSK